MGSGKFGLSLKKVKVNVTEAKKTEFSVKEKCRKLQKKLKKTDKQKTESNTKEKTIWWNQCNSCEYRLLMLFVFNIFLNYF